MKKESRDEASPQSVPYPEISDEAEFTIAVILENKNNINKEEIPLASH